MTRNLDGSTPNFKPEFLPLEGCFNFRDLGGYPASNGRRVKSGMLFRSDALQHLTPHDAQYVKETVGLATVVDFRNTHEVTRDGRSDAAIPWVRYFNEPVLEERGTITATGEEDPAERLTDMYLWAIRHGGSHYAEAFKTVADVDNLPAVFHCSAGKDRAGVFASLVLAVLGVDGPTIVEDYLVTNEKVGLIIQRLGSRPGNEHMQRIPVDFFRAQAPAMEAVLKEVASVHGDAAGYFESQGVETSAIDRFRGSLLE